ncbi:radical SAM protein [Methanolobus halotolerans]|uniref:Radical SAM protein n=1 Tax=Methanolobus halotolerans TaxID=2052935 RepID=A0A4E0QXI4_9EURY|nr:radical SAM protein [Methanolobus halotolerans]TGC07873.1 radical SAM protein [Methanolobus halotolerans]
MMNQHAIIIDGYVDEPACFGVPPYISPYIRYIAGALRERKFREENIHYFTIDSIRDSPSVAGELLKRAKITIVVSGMTVPGKYLRSTPISPEEIENIFSATAETKVLGGPIRLGFSKEGGKTASVLGIRDESVLLAQADIEAFVYDILERHETETSVYIPDHRYRSVEEIGRWGNRGAFIIKKHPDYPRVMCEIETYRGCGRREHCSFCTEPFYGTSDYRSVKDVVCEVSALYENGGRYFRIGRQPDILSYHAKDTGGDTSRPQPERLLELYKGIHRVAPELKVLHMDNVNPATIAAYPDECREILKTIVKYHTPGDVAALGMESADPDVVKANDLKAMPKEVFQAITLINEIGRKRGSSGLPELLPGINFVHGLKGETKKTFELNYDFLKEVLDSDMLLRRINIRQVMTFPGTRMYGHDELVAKNKKLFLNYKDNVRKNIDLPMLKKIIPPGTVLKGVLCEVNDRNICFGRQMGSYPLLVGIPANMPLDKFIDITVTRHGQRSITGIPYPLDINTAPLQFIQELPGIGKKQAVTIRSKAPFTDEEDLLKKIENAEQILEYLSVNPRDSRSGETILGTSS